MTLDPRLQFRHGEQDNIRVPKLAALLNALREAELVTNDEIIAALAELVFAGNAGKVFTINGTEDGIVLTTPVYVTDGDKGDVVVSTSGTVWSFDPAVITAFARTFLDDADAATVRATIGAEPAITAGANTQYWRGDKMWQTLNVAAVSGLQTALDAKLDDTQATAFGLSVVGAADAAAVRTLLDFTETVDDRVASLLAGTEITRTYDDAAGTLTLSIADDAVTNSKLANMAQATIKGRAAAAGTGDPVDLSATQLRTILGGTGNATGTGNLVFSASPTFSGTSTFATISTSGNVTVGTSGAAATATPTFVKLDRTYRNLTGVNSGLKIYLFENGAETYGFALNDLGGIEYHAGTSGGSGNSHHGFYLYALERARLTTTGLDVVGELRGDTIRIDGTATAGAVAATHTVPININGTAARMLVAIP